MSTRQTWPRSYSSYTTWYGLKQTNPCFSISFFYLCSCTCSGCQATRHHSQFHPPPFGLRGWRSSGQEADLHQHDCSLWFDPSWTDAFEGAKDKGDVGAVVVRTHSRVLRAEEGLDGRVHVGDHIGHCSYRVQVTCTPSPSRRLLRSVTRLQCKKEVDREIEHVVVKMSNMTAPAFPILKEMFPESNLIFNTRHFKPSFKSYLKVRNALPRIAHLVGATNRFWINHASFPYDDPVWWDWYKEMKVGVRKKGNVLDILTECVPLLTRNTRLSLTTTRRRSNWPSAMQGLYQAIW